MADDKQSELVQQFCLITACPPNEANFHLESCDWNLDTAIRSFFDNAEPNNNVNIQDIDSDDDGDLPTQQSADLQETFNRLNASFPPPSNPNSAPGQAALNPNLPAKMAGGKDKKKTASSSSRGAGGVRTLADLHRRPAESDSDSDSDQPQEYYTGGEKSGMLVQDPSKKPDVDDIFEKARQHNASDAPPEPSNTSSSRAFIGTGRLLSGEAVQTTPQPVQVPESIAHNITFWRNGFTVDDGPLRRLDDPANAPFLESIQNSECPQELEPADRRTKVHVNLSRKPEDYPVAQPPSYVAFQGIGRTLGSSRTDPEPSSTLTAERLNQISQSSFHEFAVDNSKPSTSISIRLSDGTRMVARFNHHHTVADIRAFINASRPGAVTTYQLQSMGFPPKALDDPTQTVEQAGLINAVVIQKL